MMADCRFCIAERQSVVRVTSSYDRWVHLAEPEPDHTPEPPLDHPWHKRDKLERLPSSGSNTPTNHPQDLSSIVDGAQRAT